VIRLRKYRSYELFMDILSFNKSNSIFTIKSCKDVLLSKDIDDQDTIQNFLICLMNYIKNQPKSSVILTHGIMINMKKQFINEFNKKKKLNSITEFQSQFKFSTNYHEISKENINELSRDSDIRDMQVDECKQSEPISEDLEECKNIQELFVSKQSNEPVQIESLIPINQIATHNIGILDTITSNISVEEIQKSEENQISTQLDELNKTFNVSTANPTVPIQFVEVDMTSTDNQIIEPLDQQADKKKDETNKPTSDLSTSTNDSNEMILEQSNSNNIDIAVDQQNIHSTEKSNRIEEKTDITIGNIANNPISESKTKSTDSSSTKKIMLKVKEKQQSTATPSIGDMQLRSRNTTTYPKETQLSRSTNKKAMQSQPNLQTKRSIEPSNQFVNKKSKNDKTDMVEKETAINEDLIIRPNNFEDLWDKSTLLTTIDKKADELIIPNDIQEITTRVYYNEILHIVSNTVLENTNEWNELVENQIYKRYYDEYSNRIVKKNLRINDSLPSSNQFKFDLMNMTQFGISLFLRLMRLVHEGRVPPASRKYVIVEDVVDERLKNSMKQFIILAMKQNKNWKNILDHNDGDKLAHPRRKQIKVQDVCGYNFLVFLKEIRLVLKWLFPLHNVCDDHLLVSDEGLGIQEMHTDDQYSFTKIILMDEIMSYDAIIALEYPVNIRYAPRIDTPPNKYQLLKIPSFGMMLFCGNTFHSGTGYVQGRKYNPRIHIYIDPPGRSHDSTSQSFLLDDTINKMKNETGNIII
jgi:hypothetical protein